MCTGGGEGLAAAGHGCYALGCMVCVFCTKLSRLAWSHTPDINNTEQRFHSNHSRREADGADRAVYCLRVQKEMTVFVTDVWPMPFYLSLVECFHFLPSLPDPVRLSGTLDVSAARCATRPTPAPPHQDSYPASIIDVRMWYQRLIMRSQGRKDKRQRGLNMKLHCHLLGIFNPKSGSLRNWISSQGPTATFPA